MTLTAEQAQRSGTFKAAINSARKTNTSKRRGVIGGTRRWVATAALTAGLGASHGNIPNNQDNLAFSRGVDTEQMYNQGKSPEARAQLEEQHRQAEMQRRNQERIKRDAYKMPPELNNYIDGVTDEARNHVQGMYENELDNKGMDRLLDQQYGKAQPQMAKQILAREKAKLKKETADIVKKQAKKALGEAFKKGIMKGGKTVLTKTFWSGFAQGSITDLGTMGSDLESWFSPGTATGIYQLSIGTLHGGKKLLGEKGVISFIEPDPFKLTSQDMRDPKTIALSGGTNILIGVYDLFSMVILVPLYTMLLVAIFIIANLLIMLIIFPYAFAANNITYFLDFFGLL